MLSCNLIINVCNSYIEIIWFMVLWVYLIFLNFCFVKRFYFSNFCIHLIYSLMLLLNDRLYILKIYLKSLLKSIKNF